MNALLFLILVLVYLGGLELFAPSIPSSSRYFWPVNALSIGFRKVWRAIREMIAPSKETGV